MADEKYLDEIRQIWDMVKETFRDKLPETTINLWFGEVDIISFENDTITLGIPSEFKLNILNKKYTEDIRQRFSEILGFEVKVNIQYTGFAQSMEQVHERIRKAGESSPEVKRILENTRIQNYNFQYTFENFIVGSTNKFAHAACVAVANNPATNYNPLFIYGPSGLGKTHLLCATVNRLRELHKGIRIHYVKGEDFTNHMISCLASKSMEEFRNIYRKCDVLLIDDIQFIAGKVSTQEEFFHTFNALYDDKKQIILTSDRPPRDIKTLEDRLRSRFEWGLIADIEPPDLELRIAIIKKKAEQVNVEIPNDVLTFLGENLRSNIRQIEGAIKRLSAFTFLSGNTVTMDLARKCILELLEGAEPVSVTVDKVFTSVYNKYGISKEDLVSPKRNKEIAQARHICVYLIQEITEMSPSNIAKVFERDRTTILNSYDTIRQKVHNDPIFASEINDLKKEIIG